MRIFVCRLPSAGEMFLLRGQKSLEHEPFGEKFNCPLSRRQYPKTSRVQPNSSAKRIGVQEVTPQVLYSYMDLDPSDTPPKYAGAGQRYWTLLEIPTQLSRLVLFQLSQVGPFLGLSALEET